MRCRSFSVVFAAVAAVVGTTAFAQLGLPMQLPQDDFVWAWGRAQTPDARRGFQDFNIVSSDGGFRCQLTGKMSISSGLGRTEARQLEQELRASMFFIQEAAYTMNTYDSYRYIEWAILDCKKPESTETEDDLAEREAKARARAERARERRRRAREED
jgi:hypothetical protein